TDGLLILFTVGHGGPDGKLYGLGQRKDFMRAIGAHAKRGRILWWELSCYACAELPAIDTLPEGCRESFTVLASSPADRESKKNVQGHVMAHLFPVIGDQDMTAAELRTILDKESPPRGKLLFAQ